MDYDRQGFAAARDGTRIFYGTRGTGPTMVLCDGIGCDGFAWRYLQPHYAATHQVVHWHYRGHGRSGPPKDLKSLHIPDLADDLRVLLEHLELDEAILVGHSMGTQVVLELYRTAPEKARALILVCGSYGKITHTFHGSDMLKQVLPTLLETVQNNRGLSRALWGRVPSRLAYRLASLSREVDGLAIREEDFRHYWEHVSVMDPDVFLATLRLAGEHSAEDLLPDIRVPTLVLAAERDTFTPPSLAEHMAELIPGAEFHLIKGGSHAVPVEQPVLIRTHIDKFLAHRLAPPPPEGEL